MSTDIGGGLHLGQSLTEVSVALKESFECFPGAAPDRVGAMASESSRKIRRYARIGRTHCRPIAEIPGFELFDGDPGHNLPVRAVCNPSGSKPGILADPLQPGLELLALVSVAIPRITTIR